MTYSDSVSHGSFQPLLRAWRHPVEESLQQYLVSPDPALQAHYGMMGYHMGWVNEQFTPAQRPAGKRLRPMLVLLVCHVMGLDAMRALPAAASVEILHNYSLIHDDIEDLDEVRRHYPTVWKVWGKGLAINAGDGMHACAFRAMQDLTRNGFDAAVVLDAVSLLNRTCVELTEGQFLDLRYETCDSVTLSEYFQMVKGKTAALFSTCLEVGALLGGCSPEVRQLFRQTGQQVGYVFQMRDDLAGIWDSREQTGKHTCKDIAHRKKSFPIVAAMSHPDSGAQMRTLYALAPEANITGPVTDLLHRFDIQAQCAQILHQHTDILHSLLAELETRITGHHRSLEQLTRYLSTFLIPPDSG